MSSQERSEIAQQNEKVYSKSKNHSLNFEQDTVASEDDLDGILRDVEKMKENARMKNKPKWKPSIEFTQKDEEELDQIFDDAERRKKEIEDLLDAGKSCDDRDDTDDEDDSSKSSSTSEESSDSDLDRLLDEEESEDELQSNKNGVNQHDEEMNREMDKVLEETERSDSETDFKE